MALVDHQTAAPAAPEPVVPTFAMLVNARGLAVSTLAVIAVVFALDWAQAFVIALLLGILIAYTLNPPVVWLERIGIPRVAATLVVMVGVIGALAFGAYSLRGEVQAIVEQLPEAASRFSAGLARLRTGPLGTMQIMQSAATEVEKATTQAAGGPSIPKQRATHVVIDQPTFKLGDYLWAGSKGAVGAMGQAIMLLTSNVLIGLLVWVAFAWIGLENAGAWAVAAGLLHIIPYLGPGVTAAVTGMAAYMQFDSFAMALLVTGASLVIATFIGTIVTTWMTGRIARMNAAAVFISLLFWGWLWGIWGMLLGISIIVIVKVVSQHVEQLPPVAELLGD